MRGKKTAVAVDGMSGGEVEGEAKSELVRGHMQRQLLLHKK